MIDLDKKTKPELKRLLDQVKVSDLAVSEKAKLIDEIELRLNGSRFTKQEVLDEIAAGMPDISDIN